MGYIGYSNKKFGIKSDQDLESTLNSETMHTSNIETMHTSNIPVFYIVEAVCDDITFTEIGMQLYMPHNCYLKQ